MSTTSIRWLLALVLLWGVVASPPAQATSAIFLTEIEHAEQSTAVVVATVSAQRVERSARWGRPITLTRVEVVEVLWGDAPATLEIEQFGGELDGMMTYVAGDARLTPGDRCVLFLRNVDGGWYLTAMEQSRYALVPTAGGDALRRELSSAYFRPDALGVLRPYDEPGPQSATLRELATLLTGAARRPARAPTAVTPVVTP